MSFEVRGRWWNFPNRTEYPPLRVMLTDENKIILRIGTEEVELSSEWASKLSYVIRSLVDTAQGRKPDEWGREPPS